MLWFVEFIKCLNIQSKLRYKNDDYLVLKNASHANGEVRIATLDANNPQTSVKFYDTSACSTNNYTFVKVPENLSGDYISVIVEDSKGKVRSTEPVKYGEIETNSQNSFKDYADKGEKMSHSHSRNHGCGKHTRFYGSGKKSHHKSHNTESKNADYYIKTYYHSKSNHDSSGHHLTTDSKDYYSMMNGNKKHSAHDYKYSDMKHHSTHPNHHEASSLSKSLKNDNKNYYERVYSGDSSKSSSDKILKEDGKDYFAKVYSGDSSKSSSDKMSKENGKDYFAKVYSGDSSKSSSDKMSKENGKDYFAEIYSKDTKKSFKEGKEDFFSDVYSDEKQKSSKSKKSDGEIKDYFSEVYSDDKKKSSSSKSSKDKDFFSEIYADENMSSKNSGSGKTDKQSGDLSAGMGNMEGQQAGMDEQNESGQAEGMEEDNEDGDTKQTEEDEEDNGIASFTCAIVTIVMFTSFF